MHNGASGQLANTLYYIACRGLACLAGTQGLVALTAAPPSSPLALSPGLS